MQRKQYISTFLERDIPQLGGCPRIHLFYLLVIPARTLYRFWSMVAHYHGQVINYRELSILLGSLRLTHLLFNAGNKLI